MKSCDCRPTMCSVIVLFALLSRTFSYQNRQKHQFPNSCLGKGISKSRHYSSSISEADIAAKLRTLKGDRDAKRSELLASNVAAQKAEIEYRDFRSLHHHIEGSPLTTGTYDYGFNTQSNDVLLLSKNSGLGGSVPAGIITLAITNFKREFG